MSDNKGNDPHSFDSYNMIGSDNNSKKNEQRYNKIETVSQMDSKQATIPPNILQSSVLPPPSPPPAANPYEGEQRYANQYTNMQPKNSGKTGVMFWVLFVLLALFDILLFTGGSGILFFILSIIVLVVLFIVRKSISKGFLKPFICFVGAFIVTFVIFAFTGTGDGNSAKVQVGEDGASLFGFSFNIGDKDKPDVIKEGFARSVEQDTLKPIEKTTVFSPNDNFIYYSVLVNYLPENTEIVAKWYYEGNLAIETEPEKMQKALKNQYYTTHLQKGEKPFPLGKYKIELVMSKDGSEIFTCSDEFSVDAYSDAQPSKTKDGNVLFEDSFKRPDSSLVGDEWQEVGMRNGTGSSVPTRKDGDTPWRIINNTLSYEGIGDNSYTEDFVQTVKEFPIDNTKVEFEIRGTVSTLLGFVGPGAFWAPSQEKRLGGFATVDDEQPLIGVQAFYGWENKGTKGLVFKVGGGTQITDGVLSGINQNEFVKHTIILKDGKIIYQAANSPSVSYDLVNKPEPGAKRHFSFDVRYYDDGIPFKTEIRNFKITLLE